ncbi:MAG: type 4a pilus biogenesis protein PilO [Chitinispirillia bacterium]|nr:type 4a pilus biogenesis protein PilO [Chitinispirillia bacterium]
MMRKVMRGIPIITLLGIAGLICYASITVIAIPQWSSYKEHTERIRHYDTFILSSEGFDKMRKELELKNETLKSKLNSASVHIPSRSISGILEELISRSKESGVVLAKIQPQAETKSENSASILVLIEATTDYDKLIRFITSLETLPQILQISRAAIETNRNGELNVRLLVTAKPEAVLSVEKISDYIASNLIDSALKAEIIIPTAVLVSEINSPFRSLDFQPARLTSKSAAKTSTVHKRLPFKLRGLMRNPQLVIVEDEKGETYIKAPGDSIKSTHIISICSNSAVFRDSSGTYELMVEESR